MAYKYEDFFIRNNVEDKGTITSERISPTCSHNVICYRNRLFSLIMLGD